MKYKLLALDIDGTLVKEHTNIVSPNVVSAIKKANKYIKISLVSARAWKDQKIIVDTLGLRHNYHVLENGTKVINPQGKIEYGKHIPIDEVKEIVKVTKDYTDEVGYCIDGKWIQKPSSTTKDITTLSIISYNRDKANKIPHVLLSLPHKYVVTVGAHWEHNNWAVTLISHKDASKGAGLKYIQSKLHVLPKDSIAVGDGASDVSTMKYAGLKVAMGNAEPELLSIASYVAPSVKNNGIVEVINKFILSTSKT